MLSEQLDDTCLFPSQKQCSLRYMGKKSTVKKFHSMARVNHANEVKFVSCRLYLSYWILSTKRKTPVLPERFTRSIPLL